MKGPIAAHQHQRIVRCSCTYCAEYDQAMGRPFPDLPRTVTLQPRQAKHPAPAPVMRAITPGRYGLVLR